LSNFSETTLNQSLEGGKEAERSLRWEAAEMKKNTVKRVMAC
jgi:hypothetical protein